MREQGVFLALDTRAGLATHARELVLAYRVEGIAEVAQDVELVEQDRRLRRVAQARVAERLPHVHHRQTDLLRRLFPQKSIELVHALLAAISPIEPDRPMLLQVTDRDAIPVPLALRDLIDADDLRARLARTRQLLPHVLLLEPLHRVPVERFCWRRIRIR